MTDSLSHPHASNTQAWFRFSPLESVHCFAGYYIWIILWSQFKIIFNLKKKINLPYDQFPLVLSKKSETCKKYFVQEMAASCHTCIWPLVVKAFFEIYVLVCFGFYRYANYFFFNSKLFRVADPLFRAPDVHNNLTVTAQYIGKIIVFWGGSSHHW